MNERYAEVIPLLEKIRAADPNNLDALLRLATAHSSLGHEAQALAAFKAAAAIAPQSPDVRTYLALHYARGKDWQQAVPLLERVVAETPDRLPAVEALASVRERQGRMQEALVSAAEDRGAASAHGSGYGAHRTAGDAAAADTAGH